MSSIADGDKAVASQLTATRGQGKKLLFDPSSYFRAVGHAWTLGHSHDTGMPRMVKTPYDHPALFRCPS